MNKDTNVIIRINSSLKENVTKIAKERGCTLSELITASLMNIEHRNMIPLNLYRYLPRREKKNFVTLSDIKRVVYDVVNRFGEDRVEKVYLFGSYARGDENVNSDIDLRFEVTDKFSLIDHSNIRLEIKEALSKDIDLITGDEEELDQFFFDNIKKEEICIYER